MNDPLAFAVPPIWIRATAVHNLNEPDDYRLLFYADGSVRFEHRCDRGSRGVIICAPLLDPRHVWSEFDKRITVTPSILCSDCGTHGFVRNGRWVTA